MKKTTRIVLILLIIAFAASVLCGCSQNNPDPDNNDDNPAFPESIVAYAPDGAPAMALANIIADKSVGGVAVATTITTGEDVVSKCASGEADMAVLPTNAAVNILSKRSEYALFTVNTYGLLYLVGTTQISSLSDLVGKTVYSIGANNTPQLVFNKILDSETIAYVELGDTVDSEKINIKYETDGSSIIPLLLKGTADFAVLGEPAVTQATAKLKSAGKTLYELGNLQELWKDATGSDKDGYPQASLIVKKSLVENKTFADALHQKLTDNLTYIKDNAADLSKLLQGAGSSLSVTYTSQIVERCNLVCLWASDEKSNIQTYLQEFGITLQDSVAFYNHN